MNLLFPTDFSEASVKAFETAWYFAKQLKLPITLLHVYPVPITTAPVDDAGITEISEETILATEQAMEERLKQYKEDLKAQYNRHGNDTIRVDTMLKMGFVADEVLHAAEQINAKFIILGVQHTSNIKRAIFGSITGAILRRSKIPVITVPESFSFSGIKQIAYATDLTYADNDVINKLIELAEICGASLKCFHVHNSELTIENSIIQDFITQYKNEANRGLISFQLIDNISTVDGIDYFVKENKIDLLALYKQKHYWIDLFDKSISKQMAFHSTVPLLIYHE